MQGRVLMHITNNYCFASFPSQISIKKEQKNLLNMGLKILENKNLCLSKNV